MPTKNEFREIIENAELLLVELNILRAGKLHFQIVHRFREPGTTCAPGEEIEAAFLMHRGRRYLMRMSCSLLLLFDYLAHHSHVTQTTSQIFAGMKADPFYRKHGANATSRGKLTRKMSRSSLREYIQRLRTALERSFSDARLAIDPFQVLVSETLLSNQAGYRLRAKVDWIHIDLATDSDDE